MKLKSLKHHREDTKRFNPASLDEFQSFSWRVEAPTIAVCIILAVVILVGVMHVIDWMLGG